MKNESRTLKEIPAHAHHQQTRADMEHEYGMPGADLDDSHGMSINPPQVG